MSLHEIILVALGSSVIGSVLGSLVTQFFIWRRETANRKKRASFLALRVAISFERFVEKAVQNVWDINAVEEGYDERDGVGYPSEYPSFRTQDLPELDDSWDALDTDLTTRAFDFIGLRDEQNQLMIEHWNEMGPPQSAEVQKDGTLRLARQAAKIAKDLRVRYGLPTSSDGRRYFEALDKL
ncbi:hypothetical protein K7H13_03435 [Qipengyuania citrea]|uniref:hypothetical protein n=1 Tax=Qipengyuania citrea TaxID=225971 RepID=UPI001E300FF1|nr:hypothetical protein [Qipengyuania citrea]MCD1589815.1 hypothetical protein [Qipengyuania citrea]